MAFSTIPAALIQVGKATIKNLWQTTKDNLDDHETRVTSLEAGANKILVFDQVVDIELLRVGEIRHSVLSEALFRDKYGPEWNLLGGQSLAGTELGSIIATAPDARGRFLRSKDNGAGNDSERAIGNFQADQNIFHTHNFRGFVNTNNGTGSTGTKERLQALDTLQEGGSWTGDDPTDDLAKPWADHLFSAATGNRALRMEEQYGDIFRSMTGNNGTEARVKNVTVNIFVKEEDAHFTHVGLFRAPSGFSLVSGRISNLEAGTSGTLSVNMFKGSSLGSMSTLLNSDITIASSAGSFATSSEASFASTAISQNDFIRFDIIGLQTRQTRFHVSLYGEV